MLFFILIVPLFAFANNGVDDFNQRKYDSAYRKLLPDAEAGQAAAMYYLGRILSEGLGSSLKDSVKGHSLISKSADKNFEPALKYLAQNAERTGNLKIALNYYERIRNNGDISVIEKIADLNEQLFNKERELTVSYCTSLDNAKTLNKSINELRYVNCIIDGKIQGKNQNEGFALLKSLAEKGNDLASLQLAPYLITSRTDKNWDPVYVDNLFFKNIENSKYIDQLRSLVLKADTNFELCRFTVIGSNFQQQNYRASLCRLAAIKGDTRAALFVAERHLAGYDGFLQDIKKATYFIDLIESGNSKIELKLYSLQLAKNHDEHFKMLSTNTAIDSGKLNEALDFQISILLDRAQRNDYSAPSELAVRAKLISEFGDCKVKKDFSNFLEKSYLKNSNVSLLEEDIAIIEKIRPINECTEPVIERPKRGVQPLRAVSAPSTATVTQTSRATDERSRVVQPLSQTAPPIAAVVSSASVQVKPDFGKLVDLCDKKDSQACLSAAELVSSKEALKEISDEGSRNKIALDLLDKASTLGNAEGKYRIYDLLHPIKFPSQIEHQKYKEVLLEFEKLKTDSAAIRLIHDSVLTFNPIASIFNTIGGRMKENCTQATVFSVKPNITAIEKLYLASVLNSVNCKAPG